MTQEEVVKRVTVAFEQANILYMLTGAIAANYYGRPRFTHDVDLVVQIKLKDADKVAKLFESDFYVAIEGIVDAVKHSTMFNLIHSASGFKVDCWVLKSEEYSQVSFSRRRKAIIFDQEMYISSPEDLVVTKLDWYKKSGIQKHYEDVLGVFEVQSGKLDVHYIKKWAKRLSFLDVFGDILKKT